MLRVRTSNSALVNCCNNLLVKSAFVFSGSGHSGVHSSHQPAHSEVQREDLASFGEDICASLFWHYSLSKFAI